MLPWLRAAVAIRWHQHVKKSLSATRQKARGDALLPNLLEDLVFGWLKSGLRNVPKGETRWFLISIPVRNWRLNNVIHCSVSQNVNAYWQWQPRQPILHTHRSTM